MYIAKSNGRQDDWLKFAIGLIQREIIVTWKTLLSFINHKKKTKRLTGDLTDSKSTFRFVFKTSVYLRIYEKK